MSDHAYLVASTGCLLLTAVMVMLRRRRYLAGLAALRAATGDRKSLAAGGAVVAVLLSVNLVDGANAFLAAVPSLIIGATVAFAAHALTRRQTNG